MHVKDQAHRLAHALDQWRDWGLPIDQQPKVVRKLHGGQRHHPILIEHDRSQWVLKLLQRDARPTIAKKNEARAQQAASRRGLAARLIHTGDKPHYQVIEFIEGESLDETKKSTAEHGVTAAPQTPHLINTIQRLQQITVDIGTICYVDLLSEYWQQLPHQHHKPLVSQQRIALEKAAALDQFVTANGAVLCHHDLNAHNILIRKNTAGQPFALIDWEFATLGPATMDLAILLVEIGGDIEKTSQLSGHAIIDLQLAADVYRHICRLYEATPSRHHEEEE